MPNPGIDMNRCAKLRWKGLYIDAGPRSEDDYSNDSSMWCLDTNKCFGRDGKVVDDAECGPSRTCYIQL